ncbi:hypothetical protein [Shouchella patagoniensis]|uniref:hypothetical protein n=1 Tax=Shouchella patagoniensis TaxID=228576 RepID=UPI0009954E1D|nr:hypothetical protein [Shouchella patagoniensis]
MDYRKRMFRGAKIEDCIEDFIQLEITSRTQSKSGDKIYQGMNTAYRYVVNRMVREFDYKKGDRLMRNQFIELEKHFRRQTDSSIAQSTESLYDQVKEAPYLDGIPEEAIDELQQLTPEYQKGMFEGMAFAYEQVANYLSIYIANTNELTETSVHELLDLIQKNKIVQDEKIAEGTKTYQEGFTNGVKAGFNLASWEIRGQILNEQRI